MTVYVSLCLPRRVSGLFQLIGVWIVSEWMGAGSPKQLQLVELGPGKGSLATDVIRVNKC